MAATLPSKAYMAEVMEVVLADQAPPQELVNAPGVIELSEGSTVEFRGRRYKTLPLGYRRAIELQELMTRLSAVRQAPTDPEGREKLLAFFADAIDLCGKMVRPVGWRALLWRIGYYRARSPFLYASEGDLVALLAGFWRCRTRITVRPVGRHRSGAHVTQLAS